jgi:molecular chaperone DnaK
VEDERVERARERLRQAATLEVAESNPENAGEAIQHVLEVKKTLAQIRSDNLRTIRQIDLDRLVSMFDESIRQHARPTEATAFDNLVNTAKRAIGNNMPDFETHLDQLRNRGFGILWRQDWFVIDRFNWLEKDNFLFPDTAEHRRLAEAGNAALNVGDIEKLREVVSEMDSVRLTSSGDEEMLTVANIIRK